MSRATHTFNIFVALAFIAILDILIIAFGTISTITFEILICLLIIITVLPLGLAIVARRLSRASFVISIHDDGSEEWRACSDCKGNIPTKQANGQICETCLGRGHVFTSRD